MPKILFTPIASNDLVEIWSYIVSESDEHIADQFLDRIKDKCELIAEIPFGFPERSGLLPGVRFFPFRNYIIFYLVIDDGIEVLRVLHGARDIEEILDDGEQKSSV